MSNVWDRLLGPCSLVERTFVRSLSASFFCPTCVVSSDDFRCPKCSLTCEYRQSVWDVLMDNVADKPTWEPQYIKKPKPCPKLKELSWLRGQSSERLFNLLRKDVLPVGARFSRHHIREELRSRREDLCMTTYGRYTYRRMMAQRQHGMNKSKNR